MKDIWLVIILPEKYGLPHYEHDGKGLLMAICLVLLEQLLSKKYACRIILIKNLKTPRKCNLCYSRKHRYEDLLLSLWWCLLKFVLTICVIYLNDITRLVVLFTIWLTGKDFFSLLKYGSFLFVFFFTKYLSSTWRIRIFVNKIQF